MVTGGIAPGKWEVATDEELCLHWVSVARQLVFLKVQQFRFETNHGHFSENGRDTFMQMTEDLNLGPPVCERRTLTLSLSPDPFS